MDVSINHTMPNLLNDLPVHRLCDGRTLTGCERTTPTSRNATLWKHTCIMWYAWSYLHMGSKSESVFSSAHLGRCCILPLLKRKRLRLWTPQASERHPCTERSNAADSDHCSPHTHQPPERTGAQHPQRSQRFIVKQPADDRRKPSHVHSWAADRVQEKSPLHLASPCTDVGDVDDWYGNRKFFFL